MRALAARAVGLVSIVVAAATLAALALFGTAPGRTALARLGEAALAHALGGEARIGRLAGAPPARIVLEDVALADREGPFFAARRVEIRWRPLDALSGRVVVDRLAVADGDLRRLPRGRSSADDAFRLPDRLPEASIAEIALENVRAPAGTTTVALRGGGRLALGGRRVDADLALDGADGRDHARLKAAIDGRGETILVALSIESPRDGALAGLSGLGGGLSVSLSAEGPPDAFRGRIAAELGAVGRLDATLAGGLAAPSLSATGAFSPGARVAAFARAVGPRVEFVAAARRDGRDWRLDLRRASAPAGDVAGTLLFETGEQGRVDRAIVRASAALAPGERKALQALLGGDEIDLAADIRRRRTDWRAAATLTVPRGRIAFEDLARRPDGSASGLVAAHLAPANAGPALLRGGLDARAAFARSSAGLLVLSGVSARTPDGAFAGDASYDPSTERFGAKGLLDVDRRRLAGLGFRARADAPVKLAASGRLADFSATVDAALPPIAALEAGRLEASLSGLPAAPKGRLAWNGGATSLRANVDTAGDVVRLDALSGRAPGFALDGALAFDRGRSALTVDLTYAASAPRALWPGVVASGRGRATGALAFGEGAGDFSAEAERLDLGGLAFSRARLVAKGPARALDLSLSAARAARGSTIIRNPTIAARADVPARRAAVSTLVASVGEASLRLERPFAVDYSDGVAIDDAALRYADGSIRVSGAVAPRRWRAFLSARDLPLAAAPDGRLAFDLDLDTDRPEAARGSFRLSAGAADGAPLDLAGSARWDGRRLVLRDDGGNSALSFDLAAPLALVRGRRLSVATDGALSGAARFRGRVETIADFLPAALQTVEGDLDLSARLGGTLARPAADGALALRNGSYTELVSGLSIVGVALDARAEPAPGGTSVRVGAVGRGAEQTKDTIRFDGEARLGAGAAFDGAIVFDGAALSNDLVDRAVFDGRARLSGPPDRLSLSGALSARTLEARLKTPRRTGLQPIEIRATGASAPPAEETAPAPRPLLAFSNLTLAAKNSVALRGRGLDSVWDAALAVEGDTRAPVVVGRLDLKRGTFDFSGRRFQLTRGSATFDRLEPNDPALDIRAEHTTRDGVLAVITVTGRALAPVVELTSTPTYPPEDVAALVLFGKRAVELSAIETLQAAQALAQLSGVGGGATRALGLDMLNVDFDGESGVGALSVGKTVARGLFVSARQDARGQNGSVRVEYGLTGDFTVETEIRQDGEQTVSANWKRDF